MRTNLFSSRFKFRLSTLLLLISVTLGGGLSTTGAQAQEKKTVRIALVSDTHTTRGTAEDQALYKGHLDQVIAQVNQAKVDVILIAGDLTQGGKAQDREDFQAQIKGFTVPVLVVPGNHDIGNKTTPEMPGAVTMKRIEAFEQAHGASFWSDTRFGVRIVGISSPMLGSGLPREAEHWTFLDKELAQPAALPTLLLTHYPLFIKTPDEPGGVYWNIEPEPRKRLLAALKKGGVKAVLSGHLHSPLNLQSDGITYVTTQPVSFGLPRGKQSEGWTLITVAPDGTIRSEPHNITH
ncbi:MAG: metallophosphoesterase [Chthonomonadaceae bacterium]|nr:metallophosphoesterase [Chthonomonadaceae bacterium]